MTTLLNKIRSTLLSPDSPLELFLRTVYHKVLSTRWYFRWQDFLAKRSYRKFRTRQLQNPDADLETIGYQPKVTFILSEVNHHTTDLEATLQSILSLYGDHWEVILISNDRGSVPDQAKVYDSRGIFFEEDFTNLAEIITGEYVLFCEAGDRFHKNILVEFYNAITEDSPFDLIYYDCEYFDDQIGGYQPLFKPSAFSPALLLSVNYLSRGFIHYPAMAKVWNQLEPRASLVSYELDLLLKLCEKHKIFHHIPEVLLTQKRLITPQMPDIRKVLTDYLTHQGCKDVQSSEHKIGTRFTWQTHSPSLAIIILSKNNHRFLKALIPALVNQPFEGKKEIHIVDNGSDDPLTTAYYQEITPQPNIAIIPYPEPFNYSQAINLGVQETKSDLVLLMNDDMAVFNNIWLNELSQWAVRPEIGVVGAKLIRKNHTIQHAGIVMGLTGFVGHIYLNAPEDYHGLLGSVDWYRNYLAMTGACQMVRREVFNKVGGYNEDYRLAFGDIDFCLKVHEKGYQNVYTPFAQLYHYEGSTRGYQTPVEDALKGYDTLETYLINEDPYFSPNLTYTRIPRCVFKKHSVSERVQQIEARKKFYLKA